MTRLLLIVIITYADFYAAIWRVQQPARQRCGYCINICVPNPTYYSYLFCNIQFKNQAQMKILRQANASENTRNIENRPEGFQYFNFGL